MSQTIKINNYGSTNILKQTYLTDNYPAATSTFAVIDSADMALNSYIALSDRSMNNGELLHVQSTPDANSLTTQAPSALPHNRDDVLTVLYGNTIRVYRADDQYGTGQQPDDDHFALIGTVLIDFSQRLSSYTDIDGQITSWYKTTYFNPTSDTETDIAASRAVCADKGQNFCSLSQIKRAAGFQNAPYITEDVVDEYRQAAQAEVISTIGGIYKMPLPQPTNPLIVQVTKDLAAGLLMIDQHQTMNPARAKEGTAKVTEARATLIELATKTLVLRDAEFMETVLDTTSGVSTNAVDSMAYANTPHANYDFNPDIYDAPAFSVKDKY